MRVSLKIMWMLCVLSLVVLWAASPSWGVVETFDGPSAGTVVAGDLPQGGTAPGTTFPDFDISVINNSGPQSCIIFDSSSPTGQDWDLGTPSQDFGGPGIGSGGLAGEPGENAVALGNLLIIAEDLGDANLDDVVDDPDDERDGGSIAFLFHSPAQPVSITLVDIDEQLLGLDIDGGGALEISVQGSAAGNNSVQKLDLTNYGLVSSIRINFIGSGAIGEIEYRTPTTATEETSWTDVKQLFR